MGSAKIKSVQHLIIYPEQYTEFLVLIAIHCKNLDNLTETPGMFLKAQPLPQLTTPICSTLFLAGFLKNSGPPESPYKIAYKVVFVCL